MTALLSLARLLSSDRDDGCAVARDGDAISTLGQLRRDVAHNVTRLEHMGVRRGLLVCDDSYWFLVGLLSLLHGECRVVVPPNGRAGTRRSLAAEFDAEVTDGEGSPDACVLRLEPGAAARLLPPFDDAREALSFFTSGSSGDPKHVVKSVGLLDAENRVLEQLWGDRLGRAAVLGTVTHQHVFGMAFKVLWPVAAGRCFLAPVHGSWEDMLAALPAGATIVSSPAHLSRLDGLAPVADAVRPRAIYSAGAPLPQDAADAAVRIFGVAPIDIFGSTETGAIAWRSGTDQPPDWQALVAGAAWCQLADRVVPLEAGRFRFEGRADRVTKVEGKRVSLSQLERQIVALPWISDVAVVTITTHRACLGAFAALSELGQREFDRLGKFRFVRMLRQELANFQEAAVLPRRWRFVDRLPTDAMGKRRESEFRTLLQERA